MHDMNIFNPKDLVYQGLSILFFFLFLLGFKKLLDCNSASISFYTTLLFFDLLVSTYQIALLLSPSPL